MAAAALALTAVGAVASADASYQAGKDRRNMADYQAAVATVNSQIAERNAQYALEKGEAQAQTRQMQAGQMSSSARAALAASGVDLSGITPSNIQGDIAMMKDWDVATIRNNAMRDAYGYRTQALNFRAQSALDTQRGKYDYGAGRSQAFTSLISGAGSFGNQWSKFSATGAGYNGPT